MSLTTTLALAVLARGDDRAAVELLSRVILHYRNTTSATGSVNETISDGKGAKQIVTEFAYEKPALLYVKQFQPGPSGWVYGAKCDGRLLMYDPPVHNKLNLGGREPLPVLEPVKRRDDTARSVADLFGGFRPLLPTADNPPLDIVFSRKEHLEFLRMQWGTIASEGKGKVGDADVTWIGGDFKPVGTFVGGHWRMAVNEANEMVRYELRQRISEKPNDPKDFVEVTFAFDVAAKLNTAVPEDKFKLDAAVVRRIVADMKANGQDTKVLLGIG